MNKIPEFKPTFAKVDDHTIKITVEKVDSVPLAQVLANKTQLELQRQKDTQEYEAKMAQYDGILENINAILESAKKLGITAKVPPAPKAPAKKEK